MNPHREPSPNEPTETDIERAAEAALRGELIVIPTDTVYGIGTRPDDAAATARLFEAKRRPRDLELPVLVPSREAAQRIAKVNDRAQWLADRLWPGPLTIVLLRTEASASWDLGGNPRTIGLRVPDDEVALAVLRVTGPLAVTSANISGLPTPSSCEDVTALFGDAVAAILCAPSELTARPSTVVDCTLPEPVVLRAGTTSEAEIRSILGAG
jgi:tRNA threonylcarbamoyl adenosine modification protein (Sua5/YciO/YrdC/YwlC family)